MNDFRISASKPICKEILDSGPKILKISKMLPDLFRQSEASIGLTDVTFGLMGVLDMFFKKKLKLLNST